jgi:hypothetical protein
MTWKDYWVGCASSGTSLTTRTHEGNLKNQLPYNDHLVVIMEAKIAELLISSIIST